MYFEFDVETPADTAERNPKKTILPIEAGVIVSASFQFQHGPNNMVHLKVFREEQQIWPVNRTGSIKGDGALVEIREALEILPWQTRLKCASFSPGTQFPHTVAVRITVLPRLLAYPYLMIQSLINRMKMVFGV